MTRPNCALLSALLLASGCGILEGDATRFIVRVDSIVAPASVGPEGPLVVRFLGMIGPNGCSRLAEVPSGRSPGLLEVQFHGELRDGVCTQEPVLLDYQQELAPPFLDPFVIRVLQPSGPPLERSVPVQ